MKRVNNLFNKIYQTSNLQHAFYKAAKGKRHKNFVLEWENNLDNEINQLQYEIKNLTIKTDKYTYFKVFDPKERIISVSPFRVRVYHHAIMNICHHVFENFQMYHSYATRPLKGTHKALKQCIIDNQKSKWFLKLDVKSFFDTVDHNVLKNFIEKRFKEKEVNTMFSSIIDSHNSLLKKGLPIGNLTSQYFANFYLAYLDRYAMQTLKLKYYIRYMDDIMIWGNTKNEIWYYFTKLAQYLKNILKQEFKTPIFNKTSYPFNFLGVIIKDNEIKPNARNRIKYHKKIEYFNSQLVSGSISEKQASIKFWAMHNYLSYFESIHM